MKIIVRKLVEQQEHNHIYKICVGTSTVPTITCSDLSHAAVPAQTAGVKNTLQPRQCCCHPKAGPPTRTHMQMHRTCTCIMQPMVFAMNGGLTTASADQQKTGTKTGLGHRDNNFSNLNATWHHWGRRSHHAREPTDRTLQESSNPAARPQRRQFRREPAAVGNLGQVMFNLKSTCLGLGANAAPCSTRPHHVQPEREADVMDLAVRNRIRGMLNLNGIWLGLRL